MILFKYWLKFYHHHQELLAFEKEQVLRRSKNTKTIVITRLGIHIFITRPDRNKVPFESYFQTRSPNIL